MLSPEEVRLLTRLDTKLDMLSKDLSSVKEDMKSYGKRQNWCREDLLTRFASAQIEAAVISTKVLMIIAGISVVTSGVMSYFLWLVTK